MGLYDPKFKKEQKWGSGSQNNRSNHRKLSNRWICHQIRSRNEKNWSQNQMLSGIPGRVYQKRRILKKPQDPVINT